MSWILALALWGQASAPPKDVWRAQADAILAAPGCGQQAKTCVAVDLHLLEDPQRGAVRHAGWWAKQLATARRLFAPVDVDFYVRSVKALDGDKGDVRTREQRDAFLPEATSQDGVDVFVVRRLADVDRIGEQIRGVHWRRRDNVERRWVILSSIAEPEVLAHELGHFFGLPHSRYRVSIMNKTPRPSPAWKDRVFADPERVRIIEHRDRMLRSGRLASGRAR